jgi:hypothetical protein
MSESATHILTKTRSGSNCFNQPFQSSNAAHSSADGGRPKPSRRACLLSSLPRTDSSWSISPIWKLCARLDVLVDCDWVMIRSELSGQLFESLRNFSQKASLTSSCDDASSQSQLRVLIGADSDRTKRAETSIKHVATLESSDGTRKRQS